MRPGRIAQSSIASDPHIWPPKVEVESAMWSRTNVGHRSKGGPPVGGIAKYDTASASLQGFAQGLEQGLGPVVGEDVGVGTDFRIAKPAVRNGDQAAIGAVLAHDFREFLHRIVGKGVAEDERVKTAPADGGNGFRLARRN